MYALDHLSSLARKLQGNRELTDSLILDILESCSDRPMDEIEDKFDLVDFCHQGAWDQAAIWVKRAALPDWTLEISIGPRSCTVRMLSPHLPPFTVERSGVSVAHAVFEACIQARLGLRKMGL